MRPLALLVAAALVGCSAYAPSPLNPQLILAELRSAQATPPADGFTAEGLVAIALVGNTELRAFRRERGVAEAGIAAASAAKPPELRFSFKDALVGTNPASLAVVLRVFPEALAGSDARVEGAQAHVARVLAEIEERECLLAAAVQTAHARATMLDETTEALAASSESHQRLLDLVDRRLAAGASTGLERAVAQLRHAALERSLRASVAERSLVSMELRGLLGLPPTAPLPLKAPPAPTALPPRAESGAAVEEATVRTRPDLRVLQAAYDEAEAALNLACALDSPLLAFFQFGFTDLLHVVSSGIEGGAALSLPGVGGDTHGVSVAAARRELARAAYVARLHQVQIDLARATEACDTAAARSQWFVEKGGHLIRTSEEAIAAALTSGEADPFKLVALQDQVHALRRDAAAATYDHRAARIRLDLERGTLLFPNRP